MTFLSHPHRMSTNELERAMYITNHSAYDTFFNRSEPIKLLSSDEIKELNVDTDTTDVLVIKNFAASDLKLSRYREDNRKLLTNVETLIDTVHQLCLELEYTTEKDVAKFKKCNLLPRLLTTRT